VQTQAQPITLSALTLRTAGFAARVEAAAAAGFRQLGLSVEQYAEAGRRGWTDARMRDLLAEHGLRVAEVELLRNWAAPDTSGTAEAEADGTVFHMARVFGADRVHATCFEQHSFDTLSAGLRSAAEQAADAGTSLALEYMPYAGVASLSEAWRLVEAAGHPAAGVLVDAWHWKRGHTTADELAAVPADRIVAVQLCDTLPVPMAAQRDEARHHRLLPGEGSAELLPMLRALRDHGVRAPVAVEVLSDSLDAQSPFTTAEDAFRTTARVLRDAFADALPTPG